MHTGVYSSVCLFFSIMNTKDRIIELHKIGCPVLEIAEHVCVTKKYVRKIIKTFAEEVPTDLTEKNYVLAIKHGFESKEELSTHFGVSCRTLQRFEEATRIKHKIARYLHIHGKTENEIKTILNTKTSVLKIHQEGTLPTIAGIKSDLEAILGVLKEYAQFDDEAQTQYYTLKRIYEKCINIHLH